MNPIKDLLDIFFPACCLCCEASLTTNEGVICLYCRHDLALTRFSFEAGNPMEKQLGDHIPLEAATALFYFYKRGKVQQLIHRLKYHRQEQAGDFMGAWLAEDMLESGRFRDIDLVVPVPLHPKKQRQRGYNQVSAFGRKIANELAVAYAEGLLIKAAKNNSQTHRNRQERLRATKSLFRLSEPATCRHKHLLLVDDVLTTGATLRACYQALEAAAPFKISVACMAYTK
ncbi:MAG: phosphoribosyltransferase family protein [Lutibacter sp.]|jgi:ComF family protein|nr:phosphoribosyltransferase family protein [Lutibacter sp.]